MNANGEALLAAVGLDAFLGSERRRLTVELREEAARLPGRIKRALRAFLLATEFERFRAAERVSYKEILGLFTAPMDPAQRMAQLEALQADEDTVALSLAADRALAALQPLLPRRTREAITGPKAETPADFQLARFRRAHAIVDDPMRLFDSMAAGTLLREEVRIFQQVYPSLYDQAARDIPVLLASILAERPRFEVPGRRDRLLRIFLQAETMDKALAKRLQVPFEKPSPEAAPPPTKAPDVASQSETQIQRISAK